VLGFAGCSQPVATVDPIAGGPSTDQPLNIFCSSMVDSDPVKHFAREWSLVRRSPAEVVDDARHADIVVVPVAELPALVETGRFLPVPPDLLGREHPYQWDSLLPLFANLFSSWAGQTYGIPLTGDGTVLLYRSERLRAAGLDGPQTWEELVAAAKKLGPNSLPALPRSAGGLMDEFNLIAVSYDSIAFQQGDVGVGIPDEESADRLFSFHYRLSDQSPRIAAPAFVRAFDLMRQMQPLRSSAVDAFGTGEASFAIASLADVARYQRPGSPVRGLFGVTAVPGSRHTYDLVTGTMTPTQGNTINRVPYAGAGSLVGLVSSSCSNPELAFEFLTSFAHPEKLGTELITAAKWGAGPLRVNHLEDRGRGLWLGFDLPLVETERLIAALKLSGNQSITNPRFPMRLPNQGEHLAEFDRLVRPALLKGSSDSRTVLQRVAEAWEQLWRTVPPAQRRTWIQSQYGLN